MNLTYLVAPMRCPRCGTVTDDETTRMETSLRPRGEPALIRPGEPVDEDLLPRRHLTIRPPAPDGPVRALEFWTCPVCGFVGWAELVVEDGRVTRIAPATVDAGTLRGVHYVTLSAGDALAERFGHPVSEDGVLRPDLVARLAHVLPPVHPPVSP